MKFGDIVALAKQGYTPADIKELLSLSEDHNDQSDEDPEQKNPEDDQDHDEGESDAKDHDEEDIDYRKELEAEREKNAKLQKIITSKDVSGSGDDKSDLDIFSDVMKNFM